MGRTILPNWPERSENRKGKRRKLPKVNFSSSKRKPSNFLITVMSKFAPKSRSLPSPNSYPLKLQNPPSLLIIKNRSKKETNILL
jgi:hypothetical protein